MAVPTTLNPDSSIYIVSIAMGSQFRGKSRDIDEYIREMTYTKPKAERQKIGSIRQSVNVVRNAGSFRFFKEYVTNDIGKAQLEQTCKEADQEMKKIDPTLHVTPKFFKLEIKSLNSGNMFMEMQEQLRTEVHERVLRRIQKVIEDAGENAGGKLSNKTKTALLKMLDKTAEINVLQDSEVTARIEAMKAQINADALIPLRDEILSLIDESPADLELLDDAEGRAIHDPDEKEYQSKPAALKHAPIEIEDLIG